MKKETKITIEVTKSMLKKDGDKVVVLLNAKDIKDLLVDKVQLKSIPVGKTFFVGEMEFIVLEQADDITAVILKELLPSMKFDNNSNNWESSALRKYLNDTFAKKLLEYLDADDICTHTTDLTADDGLKDYEASLDNVSLLTCERYRKYVYILDNYKVGNWWWLATATSTPRRDYKDSVRLVDCDGVLYSGDCYDDNGVRPFCILKSSSLVKEA